MARRANNLANPFGSGLQALGGLVAELSGANSAPVRANAVVLRKSIRKQLQHRGGPSAPGQPPARQKGRLHRSIRFGITDGTMRVGTNDFRGNILEYGAVKSPKPKSRAIAPRQFMRPGLEEALPEMTDVTVNALQKHGRDALRG